MSILGKTLTQTFRAVCMRVCSVSVYVHARKQYIRMCLHAPAMCNALNPGSPSTCIS